MITVHCLIKNEENFIWYSIESVINHVDKIMIWDTGSTDTTIQIIKDLESKYQNKISFKEKGKVDEIKYSKLRQEMLEKTDQGWIMLLDGDEIWWEDSIKKVVELIKSNGKDVESIIVPTVNLIGDIYHFQESKAGKYKFGNKIGHYSLRFINTNIPELHVANSYGKEGYFDENNVLIQDRSQNKIQYIEAPYIHATHLFRSTHDQFVMQRNRKRKSEIGLSFPNDFYYPESFFLSRPSIIPNIWTNMDLKFKLKAYLVTPLRKLKRRI